MSRLLRLNDGFEYLPLGQSQNRIRLIRIINDPTAHHIRCTLHDELIGATDYAALSYEWGDASIGNLRSIELDGKPFYVTGNLHAFLYAARRRKTPEGLWIDAISINQNNVEERNRQVRLMGKIYSAAKAVWVWLGSDAVESHERLLEMFDLSQPAAIRDLSERARIKIEQWQKDQDQTWIQALLGFCSRSYWTRTWIIQEFLKAKSVLFWISDHVFLGEEVVEFIAESANSNFLYPPRPLQKQIRAGLAWRLCMARRPPLSTNLSPFRKPNFMADSFEAIFAKYSGNACTDWHDTIYALLPLMKDGDKFPIDYSADKVSLIMATIFFDEHAQWRSKLHRARCLVAWWNVSNEELLISKSKQVHQSIDRNRNTIALNFYGSIDQLLNETPAQWTLMKGEDAQTKNVITIHKCQCDRCSANQLFSFKPGDEIYRLDAFFGGDSRVDILNYVACRPDGLDASGARYLGVLSTKGWSDDFLLHSLPWIDPLFDLNDHVQRFPAEKRSLVVDVNPSTLYFFINALTPSEAERNSTDGHVKKTYTWNHESAFDRGWSNKRTATAITAAEFEDIVNDVTR